MNMTSGKKYLDVVSGLSTDGAPVSFTMKKTLARSTFDAARNVNLASDGDPSLSPEVPASRFKVEVGVTSKYNVLICRTTYGFEKNDEGKVVSTKTKTYTSVAGVAGAVSALDPTQPADAACVFQMKDLKAWAAVETVEV
jgi:hypothetical protein